MTDHVIVIVLKDGSEFEVSKQTLITAGKKFRYLIEELNQNELLFDDFSAEIVGLFITLLDDMELKEVHNNQFRELNKLSTVFEVEWLRASCKNWLEGKINSAKTKKEKTYVFEECLYILRKWKQRGEMDSLLSKLANQDNKSFLSQYMVDLNGLDKIQLNLMLKIGGSDTEFFLRMIISNLEGKTELHQNVKHLLEHMNLALCFENNQQLYFDVCEAIEKLSEISTEDMRFVFQLTTETMKLVGARGKWRERRTTLIFDGDNNHMLLKGCRTVDSTTAAILNDKVTSMYEVVEILLAVFYYNIPCPWDCPRLFKTLENVCRERRFQKISREHLKMNILALNDSPLPQRVELIAILNEIMENDKLSTCHENVVLKLVEHVDVSPSTSKKVLRSVKQFMKKDIWREADNVTVRNFFLTYKHPSTVACRKLGTCGFIVQDSSLDDNNVIVELNTNDKDYAGAGTGLHLHDIISAEDMHLYHIWSGSGAGDKKVQVGGWWKIWPFWLPGFNNWEVKSSVVVYNIADYVVTKRD